jgi:carotenoid cleavage dioxygenase-like enzyme
MVSTRQEFTDLPLTVIEGALPEDLTGHWIAMGPVGSVAMTPLPNEPNYPGSDGTSLFNGDAMLYRFDCDRPGEVRLTNRIIKTPCYYADRASTLGTPFSDLKFFSSGLGRFSFLLGFRNEVNTACIPVKFKDDDRWRLLVAWDAGRPYEIDPVTLAVATPVGHNDEWKEQALPLPTGPFKLVTTATHHAYDDHSQELFTINFGKSLLTMVTPLLIHSVGLVRRFPILNWLVKTIRWIFRRIILRVMQVISFALWLIGIDYFQDFVRLIRWDGQSHFDTWEVVLPRTFGLPIQRPVQIEQSMHQVGVTQNYVVLMDTSFKLGPEQLIPNPLPGNPKTEQALREVLNFPQFPDTNVYLVKRADLQAQTDRQAQADQRPPRVVAQKFTIPREMAHFRVDYDDSNGVVLHVAHNNAWDPAEWPQAYDFLATNTAGGEPQPVEPRLVGMTVTTTDLNALGRYVLDPDTGRLADAQRVVDPTCTWAPAIYADVGNLGVPDRYDHIYWIAWGCWDELMTRFMVELYDDYPYREMAIDEVIEAAQAGVPPALCHLDTVTMTLVDQYRFPPNHFGNSPQFIPRGDSDDQTEGYLTCMVLIDEGEALTSQVWIFDAQNLAQGPMCKLADASKQLKIGLTIHTTWLPEMAPRTAKYHVSVREDYNPLIQKVPKADRPLVQALFDQHVYPHFPEPPKAETPQDGD